MANLVATDIKDQFIYRVVASDVSDNPTDNYLTRADLALIDAASELGVDSDDIETDTLPFIVKEYLKYYVGWEVCWNNMGLSKKHITQDGIEIDSYEAKLKYYEMKVDEFKKKLTKDVLTGDADTPEEYAGGTSQIYRS